MKMKETPKQKLCPRCKIRFLTGRDALSRLDNKTYVCSQCGTEEAIEVLQTGTVKNFLAK